MNALKNRIVFLMILPIIVMLGFTSTASAAPTLADLIAQLQLLTDAVKQLSLLNTSQQKAIKDLQKNNDLLNLRLKCVSSVSGGEDFIFEGCNVHVRNGMGSTPTTNQYGNLIVGYNKTNEFLPRPGSHNVVVGDGHVYASYGGILSGERNVVSGPNATVLSSIASTISGAHGVVVGGNQGYVQVPGVLVGGSSNIVGPSGYFGVVIGGEENEADGRNAVVAGGSINKAAAGDSLVCGGDGNRAVSPASTVCGGSGNVANGANSSISGGFSNVANGDGSSVSGGVANIANGNYSSILGGNGVVVNTVYGTSP
ncbi:MAG: hypothetical protein OEW08_11670 [Gammaproteobacteria bacterium]|nr:hypothetical protein [Gammaproteobacteria bacterium]